MAMLLRSLDKAGSVPSAVVDPRNQCAPADGKHDARAPVQMTFLRKVGHAIARDAIDDVGAMMAFYAILAVFPMLFFVVALAALVLPAHTIAEGAGLALDAAPSTTRDLF